MGTLGRRSEVLIWVFGAGLLVVLLAVAQPLATWGDEKFLAAAVLAAAGIPFGLWMVTRLDPAVPATAALVLSVFAGNWGNFGIPLPLDRLALLVALAAVAWRRLRIDEPLRLNLGLTAVLMALATAWAAGSMVYYDHLNRENVIALLDRFSVVGFVLFAFAPALFAGRAQRKVLLVGLVGLGVYLAVVTLAQGLGLDALVFPQYILDPGLGTHPERARGPFLEAAANGLALFVCASACYVAARSWDSGRARAAAAVVGLVCLASIIFTLTRQIWLGTSIALLLAIVLTPELRRFAMPVVAAGAVAVVVAFAVVPDLRSDAASRANSRLPVYDRLNSNAAGVRMVRDRPLTGFGWGGYRASVGGYYRLSPDYPLTTVGSIHNVVLSNAVALGVVGAAIWLACLIAAAAKGLRRRGPPGESRLWWTAAVAVLICWLVVSNFTPLDYSFANYGLWLFLGIAASFQVVPPRSRLAAPEQTGAEFGRSVKA